MKIEFPYGKTHLSYDFEKVTVLTSSIEEYDPGKSPDMLVKAAMKSPEGEITLRELAKGK